MSDWAEERAEALVPCLCNKFSGGLHAWGCPQGQVNIDAIAQALREVEAKGLARFEALLSANDHSRLAEINRLKDRTEELEEQIGRLKRDNEVLRDCWKREPKSYPAGIGHWIFMDEYHIANLRAAIEAIGYPDRKGKVSPLNVLNNGDWLGEIYLRLPKVNYSPNDDPDNLIERAQAIKEGK